MKAFLNPLKDILKTVAVLAITYCVLYLFLHLTGNETKVVILNQAVMANGIFILIVGFFYLWAYRIDYQFKHWCKKEDQEQNKKGNDK